MVMKKTAFFISLLAMGAFVANAQDETRTPSTTKMQNETSSPSKNTSPSLDVSNPASISTSEGTGSKSMHNGTWLEMKDLPKAVSDNISSKYMGWAPQEVYKFDNQGATAYEVVVKKNDQAMNLIYDATGNLLKTEPRSSLGTGSSTGKKSGSTTPETETR
jgi:hypothetical protein